MSIISKIKEIFTKKYKEETEYIESMEENLDSFKLKSDNFNADESIEELKNIENKNQEYAELLELLAKKIRKQDEPISKEIVSDIEKLSKDVIEPKKKSLIVSDAVKDGIQGTRVEEQIDTPEYKKLVEEANEEIRNSQKREDKAWDKAKNYKAKSNTKEQEKGQQIDERI